MSDQMIFKRYEIKYMITNQQKKMIKQAMMEHMIADEHGKSTICSLYFDTPEFLLVRRSMQHPMYKEKVRLRSYGVAKENSTVFVELKKKYDSVVYKRRVAMTQTEAKNYLWKRQKVQDNQIIRELDYCFEQYKGLAPAVMLSYQREAFYDKHDHEFRMTFDNEILWRDYDLDMKSGIYGEKILPDEMSLMEVKTAGAIPLWLVEQLSACKIYKTTFSKYGTAYQRMLQIEANGGNINYA